MHEPKPTAFRTAAIYARVSTRDQTTDNQVRELEQIAERAGWQVVGVYRDTISGAVDSRPAFDDMRRDAVARRFDVLLVWHVDRLGRSLPHLVQTLDELHGLGIGLYIAQQAIDTTTPAGRAMFQMLGVFAEFERSIISERIRAGIARARAEGRRFGRPRVSGTVEQTIRDQRAAGLSYHAIAREVGCGVSVVQRVLKQAA